MIIRSASRLVSPPEKGQELVAVLVKDNWNDWYIWKTLYYVYLYLEDGTKHELGGVKVAELSAEPGEANIYRPEISEEGVSELGSDFVSVGQDENYYTTVKALPDSVREQYLAAMHDCAYLDYDEGTLRSSEVFKNSLMRSVGWHNLFGRYRRLARGNADLTRYKFKYHLPYGHDDEIQHLELDFAVIPESDPPTNVHAIIGRNAVGKTRALYSMAKALVAPSDEAANSGYFTFEEEDEVDFDFEPDEPTGRFSGVVSVSFSAFDRFGPISLLDDRATYHYVGLKKPKRSDDGADEIFELPQKTFDELAEEFAASARECRVGNRRDAWRDALETLESDPLFEENDLQLLANKNIPSNVDKKYFLKLSSGHGIVLLIVTRLVELVEEQTLVLVDEPETHLHPPLLSAFVRTLSELMTTRNGVAILATHSPVVLQEVPQHCALKLVRHGLQLSADRPEIETFGENVGTLTREVFGLEVVKSGFHSILEQEVNSGHQDFDDIMEQFNGSIGSEGRAILRSMILKRDGDEG